jgi:hypothetical protein
MVSAECAACIIHEDRALGFGDNTDGLRDVLRAGDSEQSLALAASNSPIDRSSVEPPAVSAMWALGNNEHEPPVSCSRSGVTILHIDAFTESA